MSQDDTINIVGIIEKLEREQIKPRYHTGVGFAQLYLSPHTRLHVWHPQLPVEPEAFGCRHDHRFDMRSDVLLGTITNIEIEPVLEFENIGNFHLYEVKPAHFGETPTPLRADDFTYSLKVRDAYKVSAGGRYWFDKQQFHEGRGAGLTVTFIRKFNQVESWARILAHKEQRPKHGMDHTVGPALLMRCIMDALLELDPNLELDISDDNGGSQ